MKINIDKTGQTVNLLEDPIFDVSRLMSKSYGNAEIAAIMVRELKRQYKEFLLYVSTFYMVPIDKKALYPLSFYASDIPSFERHGKCLEKMQTIEGYPLFRLHNEIFGEKSQGDIIANKRKSLGLTQEEFCKKIGVNKTQLSNIEQGYSFSPNTVMDICRVLDISFMFPRDFKLFRKERQK